MWYIDIQWNIIQPLKKENLSFATTWIDLEGIMLRAKTEKEKYCVILLIYGIQKQTHRYREQISGYQRSGMGLGELIEDDTTVHTYRISYRINKC